MGLSDGEWQLVLNVWGKVEADLAGHGQAVLISLCQGLESRKEEKKRDPAHACVSSRRSLFVSQDLLFHSDAFLVSLGHRSFLAPVSGENGQSQKTQPAHHAQHHRQPWNTEKFISDAIIQVLQSKHAGDFGAEAQAAMKKALELFRNDIAAKYKELGFQG
uniref:Myoglobin n=1 Tax=Mustela putorius furo TaxID=9669 RepID=M3YM80_MUSPF